MGATTDIRMTVAGKLVWVGLVAAGLVAGAVNRWSASVGGAIDAASLVLFLPAVVVASVWVVRRGPRWRCPGADRLAALLDDGEEMVAVAAVRIAGTQPWRPLLLFGVVALVTLLGITAFSDVALALIFLPMAFLAVPGMLLAVGMSNGRAERTARRGPRRSQARSVPRSGGGPPSWLVLTDRRLALVE